MREFVVGALSVTGLRPEEIERLIEIPKEKERGDYAFPCFALAARLKKNPAQIAKEFAEKVKLPVQISRVEAVGPYLNFFVDSSLLATTTLTRILKEKMKYGASTLGKGKKFMIEFSQPNTHKAFHVGHVRGTSFGESIARLRAFSGYKVIRANYSGDTGMHIAKWLWAYRTFHAKEIPREDESWFTKIYAEAVQKLADDEDAQREVEKINRKLESGEDAIVTKLWKQTRAKSIAAWKPIYRDLDVAFDMQFFESEMEKPGKKIAQELVKRGIATISEEATIMDFKDEVLGVWVLLRRDGTVLYSAKDLALAEIKFKKYKVDESIVVTSVEQNLHFRQLSKTLERMHFPHWERYHHLGYESVRLPDGKMSSRTGNNVLYADFRDELVREARTEIAKRANVSEKEITKRATAIAIAAMKYAMLKQGVNKTIIFDKEEALRFEGDTGPYLLYSYARAQSILRKVKKRSKKEAIKLDSEEHALIATMGRFPEVVTQAVQQNAPSDVAHFAYALAQQFNEFYHTHPVLGSDQEAFRVQIVTAFTQTLRNALFLLGIPVLDEM